MQRPFLRVLPETLLAVIVGLLVLAEPFHAPLLDPDEGRYAEVPREMLASGDFVVSHQNGLAYLEKPPLAYWLVAGSFRLFGESEHAARLPGMLATTGTMLALFLFARRRAGERAGALAALFHGGSLLGFGLSRMVLIDPILAAAQTAAVLCFAALAEGDGSARRRDRSLAAGFAAAAAAAVLAKGLVGVVLPGGAVVIWSLVTGRWGPFRRLLGPIPVVVFLALAVPWHVAAAVREPRFLSFYFVHEHFARFLKPGHGRPGAPWYFVAAIAGGFLPWTPLLPRLGAAWPGFRRRAWAERPLEGVLWVFVLLVFCFFTLSRSKLIPYILPVFPSLSLLLALSVSRERQGLALRGGERRALAVLFGALAAATAFLGASGLSAAAGLSGHALGLSAVFLLVLLLVGSVPVLAPEHGIRVLASAWLVFVTASLAVLPAYARVHGSWPIAQAIASSRAPGDVLVQRGDYLESIPFYARQVTALSGIGPGTELDFGRASDRQGVFQTDAEFEALWNGPHRVLAVVHRDVLREWTGASARRPYRIVASTANAKHHLVTNDGGPAIASVFPAAAGGKGPPAGTGEVRGGEPASAAR